MRCTGLLVFAACAGSPRPATPPALGSIAFDGPFSTLEELCDHHVAWARSGETFDRALRCAVETPRSFQHTTRGVDRVTNAGPWRSVRVVPLVGIDNELEQSARCLLAIETARGWFASDRMIEHCQRDGDGSGFHPIGGFEVVDAIGDARAELLVEAGEQHTPPCGTCEQNAATSRAVCAMDADQRPRCTPPIPVQRRDHDGLFARAWRLERSGVLELGWFRARDSEIPRLGVVRWHLPF
jgi:hypothetical protein